MTRLFDILNPKVPKKPKIIIKPNLNILRGPESGMTTDVRVVDALIRILNENYEAKKIAVVESNSWNRLANEAFLRLGYATLPKIYKNVKLVNLSTTRTVKVLLPHHTHFKFLRLPRIFFNYDYFITIPKLKTMFPTRITCALKNQFGCIPLRFKGKYHPYLDDILANLNLLLRPDLCVVDGLFGRDVEPRGVGVLILSNDPVATDAVAAQIMGLSPRKVRHLVLCNNLGIGKMDGIHLTLDGQKVKDLNLVQKRFKHSNSLFIYLAGFGYSIVKMADGLSDLGTSIVTVSNLSTGIFEEYSTYEILRMLIDPRQWKILWSVLKKSAGQTNLGL